MLRPRVLQVLLAAMFVNSCLALTDDMCYGELCECGPAKHPAWLKMSCTFPGDQLIRIREGDIPINTTEIKFTGGQSVTIGEQSLSKLSDARLLVFIGIKHIKIDQYAAIDLDVVSLYLVVEDCQYIRVEEKAFAFLKGPLSVTITNCKAVSIGAEAFSWLLALKVENVEDLRVAPSAFVLDPTAANIGLHGPGMKIDLINVKVDTFKPQTFGSSAASIILRDSYVTNIVSDAFTANTYTIFAAYNTTIENIHDNAFTQKSLIHQLIFNESSIETLYSGALRCAISNMSISFARFKNVESGAVNVTVANVSITDTYFKNFKTSGFTLAGPTNVIFMRRNKFFELAPNAIIASGAPINEIHFTDNEIEIMSENSLGFIGKTWRMNAGFVVYMRNHYGHPCNCNISRWLASCIDSDSDTPFHSQSTCTVNEVVARCYNVLDQNMVVAKFIAQVCQNKTRINCETSNVIESEEKRIEIKNPRFPQKVEYPSLTERDKKIIGIIIVTVSICILTVMFISLVKWMNRKGYCDFVKHSLRSSQTCCGNACNRIFSCGNNRGVDSARSISQLSINEYSERHRLNDMEMFQVTAIPNVYKENKQHDTKTSQNKQQENKMTQTYELSKELLEDLRDLLDDPEKYTEARETIEHLYELIKLEESCPSLTRAPNHPVENIYEVPLVSTSPRLGKNNKPMIDVGTTTPSLDQLTTLSPYDRATALLHAYGEPQDVKSMTVNLYSEINGNSDKELDGGQLPAETAIPDVVARGPYLKAMREKISSPSIYPTSKTSNPSSKYSSPEYVSTNKFKKPIISNGFGGMSNRPLPAKPDTFDLGEGPSNRFQ